MQNFIETYFKKITVFGLGFIILLLLSIKLDSCGIKNDNETIKKKTKELVINNKNNIDSMKTLFNGSMDTFLSREQKLDQTPIKKHKKDSL